MREVLAEAQRPEPHLPDASPPRTFNIPAKLVEQVRQKIEMRRRFDAAAATICGINLKRFLHQKGNR